MAIPCQMLQIKSSVAVFCVIWLGFARSIFIMSRYWHNTILFDFRIKRIKEPSFLTGVFPITKQKMPLKNVLQNPFFKKRHQHVF